MLFRSTKNFDKSVHERPDEIKNSIIYSTKGADGVHSQTIRIILQYHDNIQFLEMNEYTENE